MVHDGVAHDVSVQSLFDKATYNGCLPESLMIDDEDEDPHKDLRESQDDEFTRSVRVRDAARRAFISVDTDQKTSQGRSLCISSWPVDF